ncbi:DUF4232 domain-containing protein [Streptomyces pinistramenti]|uniref:DUF4232 domain-containing protein n=1 Tax=Streptomyces pinistramenti TaxID=2884812 RepID=UPI001D088D90|nr:DUF4232 domain-containing protein [Streptomyces pinistramenti]MCB5908622.1 DUF4232 domain-containing protein [Streptomyces pinistramenti]
MSRHTALRHGRKAAVAATLLAAALSLTACNDGKADASKAAPAAAASDTSQPSAADAKADTSQPSAADAKADTPAVDGKADNAGSSDSKASGKQAGRPNAAPSAAGSGGRCTTAHMTAGWGSDGGGVPDMKSDQQQTAAVWLKNTGSTSCTIQGFPGFQIKGNDGSTWDLSRSNQAATARTLKPGEHTSFTIRLLATTSSSDRKVEPGIVTITPPNEKQHFQLKWPYGGAILDQSAATHPGTFVNPVNGS